MIILGLSDTTFSICITAHNLFSYILFDLFTSIIPVKQMIVIIFVLWCYLKDMNLCFLKFTFSFTDSEADIKPVIVFADINQEFSPNIRIGGVSKYFRNLCITSFSLKNRCPVYTESATLHAIIKYLSRAIG